MGYPYAVPTGPGDAVGAHAQCYPYAVPTGLTGTNDVLLSYRYVVPAGLGMLWGRRNA